MFKSWMKRSFIVGMGVTLLAPVVSHAYGEASVIQNYVARQALVPLIKPSWGNFILHSDILNKLYSLRSYQAIWVDSNGVPSTMAQTLRNILLTADRHGLNAADYWDGDVENLYKATQTNPKNWITFELAATEAMIRYATHLSTGRFDPEQIDNDIKYKAKTFNEFNELNAAVSYGAGSLSSSLDNFAPTHSRYADLMDMLADLKVLRTQGGWPTLVSPGFALKKGVKDPIISKLRARLRNLGYRVSDAGGDTFDQEFDDVLRKYQSKNGLGVDGIIGTSSEVLRALNFTVGQRISQVEVTMEKLRWLPRNVEQRHIFVNLATTEFRLFDETGLVFYFNTVNGQPWRRTPSMRDSITYVNLNPYWNVPRSIAMKDKLPQLKQDSSYLDKHNMQLIDEESGRVVDHRYINWKAMTPKEFNFYIRQLPGPDNALGVVKFPLQNPWAIYMHDTNEKSLFAETERHRSSGCVRLEQPLDLAAYLLKDQPGWSIDQIRAYVPLYDNYIPGELDKKVTLKKAMPVYFTYLTAEKADDGSMRFIEDVYGQDGRVAKAIRNSRNTGEIF